MRGMTASTGPTGSPLYKSPGLLRLIRTSNCSVSSTRTSWPRASPASTSARVLYSVGFRDRMAIRMVEPRVGMDRLFQLANGVPLRLYRDVKGIRGALREDDENG